MKRYLAVVTMLLVLVLSCTVGSAKELVWSGWSGEEAATKPMIEKMLATWNAEHPDAQIAWVGWPWGNTLEQLIIRSQGGEAPDGPRSTSDGSPHWRKLMSWWILAR